MDDLIGLARSVAFYVLLLLLTVLMGIACLPSLLAPRSITLFCVRMHAKAILKLLQYTVGLTHHVEGGERIKSGAALIASKHQSTWETFAFITLFQDPVILMKRELFYIPIYGWYAKKLKMISVDRGSGPSTLRAMLAQAVIHKNAGRQIIIFPEGTRTNQGEASTYKVGVAALYEVLEIPCTPIALNSGLFWRRRNLIIRPGNITVSVLAPIEVGLGRSDFLRRISGAIESKTSLLIGQIRNAMVS